MPPKRTYRKRPTYKYKKKQAYGPPLGTRPKMTRALRVHQNLTRDVRWFKEARSIPGSTTGTFRTSVIPTDVNQCLDFLNWGKCWEEFKVLQIVCHYFPVAVGSESLQVGAAGAAVPGPTATFRRGNVITYMDQGDTDPGSNDFLRLITKPSAKLVSARAKLKRWLTRPKGNPEWGSFESDTGAVAVPDSWIDSRITIQGQDFTPANDPGNQTWYYMTIAYKVLFRGRQRAIV